MPDKLDSLKEHRTLSKEQMKQIMGISSYVGDLGIKVLPGSSWAPHFRDAAAREQTLTKLLTGKIKPNQVDDKILQPDGFTYDFKDYQTLGLNGMVGKIREQAELYKSFDYAGFKDFLYSLRDKDVDLATAVNLFNQVGKSRVKSDLLKKLGTTGQKQLRASLKQEADQISGMPAEDKKRIQMMLETLSMRWMQQKGIISKSELEEFENGVPKETLKLADSLNDAFLDYINKGDKESRKRLIEHISENFQTIQKQQEKDETDELIDKAIEDPGSIPPDKRKIIDQMFDDFTPPQGDTPPDFDPSFSPSMDPMKEGEKNQPPQALYTIEPPLKGHYQGPVYNTFNVNEVRWETKPALTKVSSGTAPGNHTISGKINGGSMIPLYLPRNYGVGSFKLHPELKLYRDTAGCYYLKNKSGSVLEYSIPFGKEAFASTTPPGASETADISSKGLSSATMSYLKKLSGTNTAKAQQIVHYMKNILKLVYSNDASFNMIYKRNPHKYFTEIENHKKVDCDVAQTYFIALCRAAGIPSRIITGHKVDYVKNGKAIIHGGSGHAWTEIWDETSNTWKSIDATPEGQSGNEGEKQEKAPEENPDIETPPQEPRDENEPPSGDKVKEKVDKQVDKVKEKEKGKKGKPKGEPTEGESGEESVSDEDWQDQEQQMEDMQKQHEQKEQKNQEIKDKIKDAKKFDDLKNIKDEIEKSDLYDDDKQKLEDLLDANKDKMFEELKEKIEKMKDDGFIDEKEAEKMIKELEQQKENLDALKNLEQGMSRENNLYDEYNQLREEVMPLVNQWFEFFAERLPKIENVDFDEDNLTLRGRFDKRSLNKPRNLIFGRTQNPPILRTSVEPRFIASIVLDISGSMGGYIKDARKLLIFFSELFDKISEEYGYIKFSISAFDDEAVEVIKDFDQEYSSSTRYNYGNSPEKTVKLRLMEMARPRGGTDMGKAVWQANKKLNEALLKYPDHLSALYTISDGETGGELAGQRLHNFLHGLESVWGEWWGNHMKCGYMLGPESQKAVLSQYFGENDAESVPEMDKLIEKVMMRFDEDVQHFIDNLPK